jgi:putative endonuclease
LPRKGAHNELGSHGEDLAAEFLVKKGYKIHVRNLRLRIGEVDLVCLDGETVVIVEVKTQTADAPIDPVFKIDSAKQRKLRQLAKAIAARYPDRNIRVDAVTVVPAAKGKARFNHLENIL